MRAVAIVGFAGFDRALAEARRLKDVDLWGFNDPKAWRTKRVTPARWFELHRKLTQDDIEDLQDLEHSGVPIYLRAALAGVPNGIPYPKQEIIDAFGTRYFTNSVSWMLALAIHERRPAIHILGVDMADDDRGAGPNELAEQRPSVEFFLGWARGAGIPIHIPEWSDLLKTTVLYGFEDHADSPRKKLRMRRDELTAKAQRYAELAAYCRGAAQAMLDTDRTWMQTNETDPA